MRQLGGISSLPCQARAWGSAHSTAQRQWQGPSGCLLEQQRHDSSLHQCQEAESHYSHITVASVLQFQVTSKVRREPSTGNELSSSVPNTGPYLAGTHKFIQEPQSYPTCLLQRGQSTRKTGVPWFILKF